MYSSLIYISPMSYLIIRYDIFCNLCDYEGLFVEHCRGFQRVPWISSWRVSVTASLYMDIGNTWIYCCVFLLNLLMPYMRHAPFNGFEQMQNRAGAYGNNTGLAGVHFIPKRLCNFFVQMKVN